MEVFSISTQLNVEVSRINNLFLSFSNIVNVDTCAHAALTFLRFLCFSSVTSPIQIITLSNLVMLKVASLLNFINLLELAYFNKYMI